MNKRITISVFAVFVMLATVMLSSCGGSDGKFQCKEMTITLEPGFSELGADETSKFSEDSMPDLSLSYGEDYVYIYRSAKEGDSYSLDEYAQAVRESNMTSFTKVSEVKKSMGVTYIEVEGGYAGDNAKGTSKSIIAVYDSRDALWMVQFGGNSASYATNVNTYLKWARSVSFSEK